MLNSVLWWLGYKEIHTGSRDIRSLTARIFPVSDLMAHLPICNKALSERHPGYPDPHYRWYQIGLIFNNYKPYFLHTRKKDSTRCIKDFWLPKTAFTSHWKGRRGGCSSRQPIGIFVYWFLRISVAKNSKIKCLGLWHNQNKNQMSHFLYHYALWFSGKQLYLSAYSKV